MGGGGADGHPKSPAMTAVHFYFLGTRHRGSGNDGGNLPLLPPDLPPHLDVCPVLPSSKGGLMSDLLPGGLEFTGTGLSSEQLASDPASCFSTNVG